MLNWLKTLPWEDIRRINRSVFAVAVIVAGMEPSVFAGLGAWALTVQGAAVVVVEIVRAYQERQAKPVAPVSGEEA